MILLLKILPTPSYPVLILTMKVSLASWPDLQSKRLKQINFSNNRSAWLFEIDFPCFICSFDASILSNCHSHKAGPRHLDGGAHPAQSRWAESQSSLWHVKPLGYSRYTGWRGIVAESSLMRRRCGRRGGGSGCLGRKNGTRDTGHGTTSGLGTEKNRDAGRGTKNRDTRYEGTWWKPWMLIMDISYCLKK